MKRISLVAMVVVFTSGCSSKSSGFQPIDGATAPAAGQSLGDSAESSASGFGTGPTSGGGSLRLPSFNKGLLAAFRAEPRVTASATATPTPTPSATPTASPTATATPSTEPFGCPADSVSVDQTGASSATITIGATDPCSFSGPDGTETITGTITEQATESVSAGFDFTLGHDITVNGTGAGPDAGATAVVHLTGNQSASFPLTGTSFTLKDQTSATNDITDGQATYDVTQANSWEDVYTPGSAWTPGTPIVAGGLAISGGWSVSVSAAHPNASQAAAATLTSSGLQIDPACPTSIVGGSLTATWMGTGGQSASLTVTWTACGARTASYTGP